MTGIWRALAAAPGAAMVLIVSLAYCASGAVAPSDSLTKANLFEAGQGGYATYRIPGVVVTKAGTVLAYCEGRKTGMGDWDASDVLLRRGPDGGAAWEAARKIAGPPADVARNPAPGAKGIKDSGRTTNNPVAITDPVGGAVHFLYCVNYNRCFYMRSDDDGKSFSKPVEITGAFEKFRPEYRWQIIATGPGHGVRLSSGRLIVAVWLSLGAGGNAHHPSCVATIYSDDDGKTWRRGDIVVNNAKATPNPNETAVAQLSDGRVMLNIRTESSQNRRLVAVSPDGASHWSKPIYDDALFEPICFGSLLALPNHGGLLFCNPDSSTATKTKSSHKPRKNLTVRFSPDDGMTWPIAKVIEPGIAGYSDLAGAADGAIYCFYERGGIKQQMFHTQSLCLARFTLDWIKSPAKK